MNQKAKFVFLVLACLSYCTGEFSSCVGQDNVSQDEETDKAAVVFDFRLANFADSSLMNEVDLGSLVEIDSTESPLGENFRLDSISRTFGAFSVPEKFEDLYGIPFSDSLPFNFFVQVTFTDEEFVENLVRHFQLNEFPCEMIDERCVFQVQIPDTKQSISVCKVGPKAIVFGTREFILKDRRELFSTRAIQIWNECQRSPLRIAFDLELCRDFFLGLPGLASAENAELQELVNVLKSARGLSFSFLPKEAVLLEARVTPIRSEQTMLLQKQVDFLSYACRAHINRLLLPAKDSQGKSLAQLGLSDLRTDSNETGVTFVTLLPDGMGHAIGQLLDVDDDPGTTDARITENTEQ